MTCNLELIYNDDTWSKIVSPDQEAINQYLASNIEYLIDTSCLHVGIGTSSILKDFHSFFSRIEGITIMDSEIEVANNIRSLYELEYKVYKINKYNKLELSKLDTYDYIIDNNPHQHACCNEHWQDYFTEILNHLSLTGVLITHTQGFCHHTGKLPPLTIQDLQKLIPSNWKVTTLEDSKNSYGHYPLLIGRDWVLSELN